MNCGFRGRDLGNQRVHRPHAGDPGAEQVTVEQANPLGLVERRKDLIVAQPVAEIRPDAPAEVRLGFIDLEEARPLHHPGFIERHVDRIVCGSLFKRAVEVLNRQIIDAIFVSHHGVTEAKRAVRELERNFPVADRNTLAGFIRPIDEVRSRPAIGRIDRRVNDPPHQIVAENVVVDQRDGLAGAQEALIGGAELAVRPAVAFLPAYEIDQGVVQQREQRGQLRHHGVIIIPRVGDQGFGEGNPDACDAAVDPRHILGPGPCDVAKRAAGRGFVLFPAHSPEPQLGAPVVTRRVERVNMRRSDRTASVQGFQPKRRTACIGGAGAQAPRN